MQDNDAEEATTNTDSSQVPEANPTPTMAGDVIHPDNLSPSDENPSAETTGETVVQNSQEATSPQTESTDIQAPAETPSEPNPELLAVTPKPVKNKSKKGLLMAIVLFVIALLGAGGWWYSQRNDTGNTDVSQTSTVKETQDIELLRVGSSEGPASVYFPDEGLIGVQIIIDHQIYEGLVGLDENKIVPLIAQSWTNPDDTTWVFKIRPNVKFHTGKAVTAAEVKASLESLSKYDYWSSFISTIDSIEATGELELTIKTKVADALILNRLVQAFVTDLTASDKSGNNGTGAYQVDATATNDEKSTTLVAFDDYYGGHIKTRKLKYTIYDSDDAIVKALKNKEIDIAETVALPSVIKEMENTDYNNLVFETPGVYGLYMNQIRTTNTILKNKDFRQAIALAIDRNAIVEGVGRDISAVTQVIPKSLPGYDKSISFPAFDLTAAKASLLKSGYNNQVIEFIYVKDYQLEAPILIQQLKALGLNIKERPYTTDEFDQISAEAKAGRFDLFFAGYTSDISDARDILGSLLGSTERAYPVYGDPAYDKILNDSDKAFDPTERIKLLQQANKYILDNFAWIPLRNGTYIAYTAKDLDIKVEFNGGGSLGVFYREVGRVVN